MPLPHRASRWGFSSSALRRPGGRAGGGQACWTG
jgi:hypothetical protein